MLIGRRTLEIGVVCIALVLIVSVSCVMSKACPSGFYPVPESESANSVGSMEQHIDNIIPVDDDRRKTPDKEATFDKDITTTIINNLSTTAASTTTSTTEGTTPSTTTMTPVSVTIFSANNHYGRSAVLTFTTKDCQNLSEEMRNRVNSIDTKGQCAILCDKLDCGGWCVQFAPGTPAHHRFRKLRFQNRAESAIACE